MSDYLNKRGKELVALALTDSNSQQKLDNQNYRSVLEAQRDLFESNTEHVQLDDQRDAEGDILNKSRSSECTKESLASSSIKNRNKDEDGNTIS
ncbi:unnamed protein product [Pieris macdunnoughi]|uniref:Uncharacterized protein n=1 Tax=Pieris macdunnoughi TaxID=345717 RepID=A0A821UGG8_9NEOP|nr:unnamed protein product [Pieris macdunnoughi]